MVAQNLNGRTSKSVLSMRIDKKDVSRVVDSCYSGTYKIFTINSTDGYTTDDLHGLFVSLGVNSRLDTINKVIDVLRSSFESVELAEIESKFIDSHYVNRLVKSGDSVTQFKSDSKSSSFSKEDLKSLLSEYKAKLASIDDTKNLSKCIYMIYRLSKVMDDMKDDQTVSLCIDKINGRYYRVNDLVNYKVDCEDLNGNKIVIHKRIGILLRY